MPLASPIRGLNGELMHEIIIPKGTTVTVGTVAWNVSRAHWGEDANEWKPDRWLKPLPEAVSNSRVPGIYGSLYVSVIDSTLFHGTDSVSKFQDDFWCRKSRLHVSATFPFL